MRGNSALINRGATSIDIPTSIDTSVEWLKRQIFKVDNEVVKEADRSPEPQVVTQSVDTGSEPSGIEENSSLNKSDFDVFIEDLKSHLEAAQTLTFVQIQEKIQPCLSGVLEPGWIKLSSLISVSTRKGT